MLFKRMDWRYLLVIPVIASITAAGPSRAASAGVAAPVIPVFGVVDQQKILSGYSKRADIDKQIQDANDALTDRLQKQAGYDMLSVDQQEQLGALLAEPTLTDQDQSKVTQLENTSSSDSKELADLQQMPNLTDVQKAQLTALTNEHQAGQAALKTVEDNYSQEFSAEKDKIIGNLGDQVRAIIAQVAKDKGITVVFDSGVALYCENDITDEVLKRLNAAK